MSINRFAVLLREHRLRLQLTQEELAERSRLSARSIGDMERGRSPRPRNLELLATALDLSGVDRIEFVDAGRTVYWTSRAYQREAVDAGADDRAWTPPVPAQLPPDVPFAGRAEHLERLRELAAPLREEAAALALVVGPAGIGKTALAVHCAHRLADRFPDGQLYLNLRGFEPSGQASTPGAALRQLLDTFAVPTAQIPSDVDAQGALYRSLLSGRRMIVVLDNARNAEQVRPLLPGTAGCLTIVTSRHPLRSLVVSQAAEQFALDVLTAAEAGQLLEKRLGRSRLAGDPEAADAIIRSCAGLPLALAIVAGQVAGGQSTLQRVAQRLGHARLDAFADADPVTDLRAVFSWSYEALREPAGRLFRLLGLHPGPTVSAAAAASLVGLSPAQTKPLLAELTATSLLSEPQAGRFAMHDLLRSYAAELTESTDSGRVRAAARRRLCDHYLHTGWTAATLISPHRSRIQIEPARPGTTVHPLTDRAAAQLWFSTEHAVLTTMVGYAAGHGLDTHAWQVAWTMVDYFYGNGYRQDWIATHQISLEAATRLDDQDALGRVHRGFARVRMAEGEYAAADDHLNRSLAHSGSDDVAGSAHSHLSLSWLYERQSRHRDAVAHAQLALEMFRRIGGQVGQADALNQLAWSQAHVGEPVAALAACQEALSLQQIAGNEIGEAATWDTLGFIHLRCGNHAESFSAYRRAVDLFRTLGDRVNAADTLVRLGDAYEQAGAMDQARAVWLAALPVFEEVADFQLSELRKRLAAAGALAGESTVYTAAGPS